MSKHEKGGAAATGKVPQCGCPAFVLVLIGSDILTNPCMPPVIILIGEDGREIYIILAVVLWIQEYCHGVGS